MVHLSRLTTWSIAVLCLLVLVLLYIFIFDDTNEQGKNVSWTPNVESKRNTVRLWFFALDCDKPHLTFFAKQAVTSALYYSQLVPVLILHCSNSELEMWMKNKGVIIVDPANNKLVRYIDKHPEYLTNLGLATWLRLAIPTVIDELIASKNERIVVLHKENPHFLEYALYTDADITFMNTFSVPESLLPRYFALPIQGDAWCCADNTYQGELHTNAGVILMNVTAFREIQNEFTEYILRNLKQNKIGAATFNDQTAFHDFFPLRLQDCGVLCNIHLWIMYRKYFHSQFTKYYSTKLPKEFEWEPYLGVNRKAIILHWHGPKVVFSSCAQLTNSKISIFMDAKQSVLYQLLLHNRTSAFTLTETTTGSPHRNRFNASKSSIKLEEKEGFPQVYDWYTSLRLSDVELHNFLKKNKNNLSPLQTLKPESLDGYQFAVSLFFSHLNMLCNEP